MTQTQRQQLLSVLLDVHADLSRAIHARHPTVDVTTASDLCLVSYCTTCKVYYQESCTGYTFAHERRNNPCIN
jgi:hypothetical protein